MEVALLCSYARRIRIPSLPAASPDRPRVPHSMVMRVATSSGDASVTVERTRPRALALVGNVPNRFVVESSTQYRVG